jgi:hypothetical protein
VIFQDLHVMASLRELWTFNSFRARIFLAIVPTCLALVFGHYALDRQRPYDFYSQEQGSYIEPAAGRGGESVTVNWRVHYHRSCSGVVERQLIDPDTEVVIAVYDPQPAAVANGMDVADGYLRKQFALPRDIRPGTIAYHAKLTYTCNWLQKMWPAFAIKYATPKLLFIFER